MKAGELFRKENLLKVTVFAGLAGILLIFASSLFGGGMQKQQAFEEASLQESSDIEQYRQGLCEEMGNMLASIQGVGKTKLMLTLDGTRQNIYATDNDIRQRETSTGENADKQNDEKQSCIVIRQKDGSEQALTIGQLLPKIKGVLVVCEGGDDPEVCSRVQQAVSAALDVSRTHICVTKMDT